MAKFTIFSLAAALAALPAPAADATPVQSADAAVSRAAEQLIRQRLDEAGLAQADVKLQLLPPRSLPACAAPWRTDAADSRAFSRMRFDVSCPADGWRGSFIVRAAVTAQAAVAARNLRAGEVLQAEDIAWEARPVAEPADLFGQASPPLGLAPRTTVAAGQPLRRRQLQAPLLVKRGAEVRIVARQDGIEVSAAGEALADGRQGETIRVRNLASGKTIRGRVGADGVIDPLD
ncbi:flagellar basal body P-ring formation chaperone FlgA [Chromobacterium vaccinii]|uniref:flagellar basal body P-ring formation chaperone FlgA n=1 Tax=Chromobacterium vaccinii TaxID=1108595 RepID=UPI003C71D95E